MSHSSHLPPPVSKVSQMLISRRLPLSKCCRYFRLRVPLSTCHKCRYPLTVVKVLQVFSSPSAIEAWQYIPVDEDMVIDSAKSSILLTSDLGPLYTQFGGTFSYDGPANVMEWGFTGASQLPPSVGLSSNGVFK
jgi:hypothetical protein